MNKLTKSDVRSAMLRSMCYQWQSFNYETMQSPGFAQMIAPSIEKIYEGDDELISKKVEQYLSTFYNTENTMGQIIHGAVLALEESGVENITDSAVALRTGLMGPFAGLGDSLFKVSSKVIFGSLAGYMALEGSIVGLILCIILCLVCNVFIRYFFFMEGYKQGVSFITTKQDKPSITNQKAQELCGFNKNQTYYILHQMCKDGILQPDGVGRGTKYKSVK